MFDFFDFIKDWVLNGIYTFFTDLLKWFLTWMIVSTLETVVWALDVVWSVAEAVIDALNITDWLALAFSHLPTQMRGYAAALRLPEVVNVLMTGAIAKFTLRFIPFL